MRIGIITGEYPPLQGGIGAYSDILARQLHQAGHDVLIFSDARAEQQSSEIPLTTLRGKWGFNSYAQINQWASEHRLDLLNLQFQTAAFAMSPFIHFLPQATQPPFVTTFHDLRFPYLFPKAGALRDWIVMHLASTSDSVITTNSEDHIRVTHLPHTAMIPIGSNIATALPPDYNRAQWRSQIGAREDTFVTGFFGFLNHSKGYDTLIQAVKRLRDAGVPVRLLRIGGRTGTADPTNVAYADEMDALIQREGLTEHVHITGYADDAAVSAYLRACDVVALPFRDGASYRRGSLMAAITHECAIVTTHPTTSIPPFNEATMCLVPPDDPLALAQALEQLYTSPSEIARLQSGIATVTSFFDWEHIAQQHIEFFQQVIGKERT